MPDVLLNNDDIAVLGSPPVVELLVDIGPKGDAGSQVLVGLGNPNTISIGQLAGQTAQGQGSVAIGVNAGATGQGGSSVAIGNASLSIRP